MPSASMPDMGAQQNGNSGTTGPTVEDVDWSKYFILKVMLKNL